MVRQSSPLVRGQAALILIMIMAVVGAVSVGVASRSVENLRTQEIENTSSRSFKAAEAALEVALSTRADVPSTELPGGGTYSATYTSTGIDGFVSDAVEEGDVVQISLSGAAGITNLNLYWNANTAVMVSVLSGNAASGYSVQYYTADPDSARAVTNKFETTVDSPITYSEGGYTFKTVSFDNKLTVPINLAAAKPPAVVRVKVLYAQSSVGVEPVGGTLASGQTVSINAVGTVADNVVTNLTFSKSSDRVPVIFDNVLYTNGSLIQ